MFDDIRIVKDKLSEAISQLCDVSWMFVKDPKRDFTRNRKLLFEKVVSFLLAIVRFHIADGVYETLITNLDRRNFPASELKRLYHMRWGIETSFRELKYTVGLLHFHAKRWSTYTRRFLPD